MTYIGSAFPKVATPIDEVVLPSERIHELAYEQDRDYRSVWDYMHGFTSRAQFERAEKRIAKDRKKDIVKFIKSCK